MFHQVHYLAESFVDTVNVETPALSHETCKVQVHNTSSVVETVEYSPYLLVKYIIAGSTYMLTFLFCSITQNLKLVHAL